MESTYLTMWRLIKQLTPEQTNEWIEKLSPARGQAVRFREIMVVDVDVLEALRHMKEEHDNRLVHPYID